MHAEIINSRKARDTFADVMKSARAEKPVIITSRNETPVMMIRADKVEALEKEIAQLREAARRDRVDSEIDALLFTHSATVAALADR